MTEIDLKYRRDVVSGEHAGGAYRQLRDSRFGARLTFQFSDGRRKSLPYAQLVETEYNPDIGVILTFIAARVTLSGRNLLDLALRLEEETCGEIHERHDYHGLRVEPGEPYVEAVGWEMA